MVLRSLFLAAAFALATAAAAGVSKPNIVLIMADDLGFADIGCYGSEIETPNLDALAKDGLRFTQFYNTAKCHSSRVSLLTGRYCGQAGNESLSRGATIAEVLKPAGYATLMVGKWHLKDEPTDRGFERYFGHLSGATNFFTGDDTFRLDGEKFDVPKKGFYTTDAKTDYAIRFVSESLDTNPDKPFFLYCAYNAPHYPLHAPEAEVMKYRGNYKDGWDRLRNERYTRQLQMGLLPAKWALSPRPDTVRAWKSLSAEDKDWEDFRMAAYAGMVDRLDQQIGRLIAHLKAKGVYDNTLVMFCSDNGACPFERTRGKDKMPWDPESYWTYDTGWAHAGNTPFRWYKQNQHEGGISGPMIAHWPAGMKREKGSFYRGPSHLVDFMATCLELGKAKYPEEIRGGKVGPLVGKSLAPVFAGEEREGHEMLYFRFSNNRALRKGKWKVVSARGGPWELYDIDADRTELNDLAKEKAGLTKELSELWLTIGETDRRPRRDKLQAKRPAQRSQSAPSEKPNIILIYTDDHGWPDIGPQGIHADLKTPHLDALAAAGVCATNGYSSAPQCVPSRAGLMIGKYQNRFGVEANGKDLTGFDKEQTVAERLKEAGYTTAQIGKWHLGPGNEIDQHGFDHFYNKNANRPSWGNFNEKGESFPTQQVPHTEYHLDACSSAAVAFIRKAKADPFFLYLAYRAPHVPLDAPQKHLDRFPGEMPERRRQALAMIAAMDDGVGAIVAELKAQGITDNTLIFYIGDNGAPLKIHKVDAPGGGPGWDGSLNEPLNGEKGMLTEGGIRVPFLISWPGTLPAGRVCEEPVIALDATATALHVAGLDIADLDGVNIIPALTNDTKAPPHNALYWRWLGQSAIREGDWKLLRGAGREYLFNLSNNKEETKNLLSSKPEIADKLRAKLKTWADTLTPPGLNDHEGTGMTDQANAYFDWYLDGKRDAKPPKPKPAPKRRGPTDATIFAQRDKNADGEVTLEEWIAGRTEKVDIITANFHRRDLDQNGIWEKSEIRSAARP